MIDNEFLKKLRGAFKSEAEERLKTISSSLADLKGASSSTDKQKLFLEIIFREAHSLKGASRVVNFVDIETICQSVEETFGALKREEIQLSPEIIEKVHYMVDTIERFLKDLEKDQIPLRGVT
jgi:two-component system chemotaxis sensor kinase CheA